MVAIQKKNGKLEVDYNKKAPNIDLRNPNDMVRQLLWMIVTLDQRVQALGCR